HSRRAGSPLRAPDVDHSTAPAPDQPRGRGFPTALSTPGGQASWRAASRVGRRGGSRPRGSATSSCHEHPSAYPGTEGCERATRQSGRAHAAGASAMGRGIRPAMVGRFRGDSSAADWRLTTTPSRTPDEWAAALTSYLAQEGRSTQEVRAAVVASVVPPVTQGLCEAVERATTVRPVVVDGRSRLPITLDVEEPLQVGADRILNTLAAAQLFHRDSIVVDFGTATTFDCITADGHFLGGVIMPG